VSASVDISRRSSSIPTVPPRVGIRTHPIAVLCSDCTVFGQAATVSSRYA
jgi:hypothetical protein